LNQPLSDEAFETKVRLHIPQLVGDCTDVHLLQVFRTGKSVCGRFRLANGHLHRSIFVKHVPDDVLSDQSLDDFKSEVTAYRQFSNIPVIAAITPQMLGYEFDSRLLVLQDLGEPIGPNTADLLSDFDPDAATHGLLEGVVLLADLHGSSVSIARQFMTNRIESGLPLPRKPAFMDPWPHARLASFSPIEITDAINRYSSVCLDVGVSPSHGFQEEIEQVIAQVEAEPSCWLAICKGDQNMAGDYIRTQHGPILYDFDSVGARHLFLEGMPGRMTWGCMMGIPPQVVQSMQETYLRRIQRWVHEAFDQRATQTAMADAAARWHIFHVVCRLSEALQIERPRGPTSLRQQTSAWIRAFIQIMEETGGYPHLCLAAKQLIERLASTWPHEQVTLPLYPAFKHGL